jgi:hypothetical protein
MYISAENCKDEAVWCVVLAVPDRTAPTYQETAIALCGFQSLVVEPTATLVFGAFDGGGR